MRRIRRIDHVTYRAIGVKIIE
uniref:NERD domain-containing protein n=1 Tax=Anguilla anguilla TaxID=7936 RepID=A0A0E9V195_ANGAN